MVPVVISVATVVVACPFLVRLRWAHVAARRACHFHLVATGGGQTLSPPAMLAALSSLGHRRVRPPLVVVHRYRRDGAVRTALSVVSRHPDRVAELIAEAAGGRAEPTNELDLPPTPALRTARRSRSPGVVNELPPDRFGGWIDSVLAGAGADAILSVGVTPAARWEDEGNDAPLRARILAGAGDPVTAGTLAAGCGAHLPGRVPALLARRPGDGPVVAAGAALAVGSGITVAAGAALNGRYGAALAALEAGLLAAGAIAGVAALRLVRVTELCWRRALGRGLVLPERPWRLARRHEPTTRRSVALGAGHLTALCTPPPAVVVPAVVVPAAVVPPSAPAPSSPSPPPPVRRPPPAWVTSLEAHRC